jgi:hypothetical protein
MLFFMAEPNPNTSASNGAAKATEPAADGPEAAEDGLGPIKQQRNGAATAFVGFLIGLAYQEAVGPVRDSVRDDGVTFGTIVLFLAFLLTGLATFLAGYYNLVFSPFERLAWFANFAMLLVLSVLLVFIGGVASPDASRAARYGFIDLLLAFFVVSIVWEIPAFIWTVREYQKKKKDPTQDEDEVSQSRRHWISSACTTLMAALGVIVVGGVERFVNPYSNCSLALVGAFSVVSFATTIKVLLINDLL